LLELVSHSKTFTQADLIGANSNSRYINAEGRNPASWPGKAADFWKATSSPKWADFVMSGGEKSWALHNLSHSVKDVASWTWPVVLGLVGLAVWKGMVSDFARPLPDIISFK
jgi:hypothetical protein